MSNTPNTSNMLTAPKIKISIISTSKNTTGLDIDIANNNIVEGKIYILK